MGISSYYITENDDNFSIKNNRGRVIISDEDKDYLLILLENLEENEDDTLELINNYGKGLKRLLGLE